VAIRASLGFPLVGSPRAAFVSFLVGTLALLVVTVLATRGLPSTSRLADAPWWIWLVGLFGALYVFGSIVTASRLGAVALVAAVVAGQSLASVVIDHSGWVGFQEHPVAAGRLAGVVFLGAGVGLVRVF
jgi:bacterial/archaeal transporter family-2 protein